MSRMANTLLSSPDGTWACMGNGLFFAPDAEAEADPYVDGACLRVPSPAAPEEEVVEGAYEEVTVGGRGSCVNSTPCLASSTPSVEVNLGLGSDGRSDEAPP
jgi:hypothetical protein